MARLYKRKAVVTISSPGAGSFFGPDFNQLQIEDLRVQFEITKSLKKEPNTGNIVITNLAERTRSNLQEKGLRIRLEAGYEAESKRLFSGDIRHVKSISEGSDWITTIELGDGERGYRHGRVNRTFRKGATVADAIRDVAAAMNLSLPASVSGPELQAQFAAGVSLFGPASSELTRLLAPYGFDWSIQDGQLQILATGATRAQEAILISQDTGMIGTPEFGSPEKRRKKPILMVRSLLNADIVPGGRILLQSSLINGLFKTLKASHAGDTHGGEWTTKIEATKV